MARSLSARLLLPVAVTAIAGIVLLSVAGGLWMLHSNRRLMEGHQHRDAELIAQGLAHAVAPDLVHRDYGALEARLLQTASEPHVVSALVIDLRGQVLARVAGRSDQSPPHPLFDVRHVPPPADEHLLPEKQADTYAVWHVVAAGPAIGWVRVELANDAYVAALAKMRREVLMLAAVVSAIGVLCLGVAVLRSYRLVNRREAEIASTRQLLESRAYHDPLTQLPNRVLMFDRLNQAIAATRRAGTLLAVCFIDLDEFKAINDAHGHLVGDQVLVEVARRLGASVRGEDTVARIGGDEFVALLGGIKSAEEAERAVERLLTALDEPLVSHRLRLAIHPSIGYALYPLDCTDRYKLVVAADRAMYEAKSSGGATIRRYRVSPEAAADPAERVEDAGAST